MTREIRDLLTHASESFDTVQVELRVECDTVLWQRAFERSIPDLQEQLKSGAVAILETRSARAGAGDGDQRFRHDWRAWWRKPSSWRDDITWEGGATGITIVRGAISCFYVSQTRTLHTTERPQGLLARLSAALGSRRPTQLSSVKDRLREIPLLEPSFLASGWELTVLGERTHAGRDTVRAKAKRIATDSGAARWEVANECEVLVDRERGVLLRYAAIVDGAEAKVFSVRSVRFDDAIPDEVFAYEPPKGTKIVWCTV